MATKAKQPETCSKPGELRSSQDRCGLPAGHVGEHWDPHALQSWFYADIEQDRGSGPQDPGNRAWLLGGLQQLYAYDDDPQASRLSPEQAEELRTRCLQEFDVLRGGNPGTVGELDAFLARIVRRYILSEEAIATGAGLANVLDFVGWLQAEMGCYQVPDPGEGDNAEPDSAQPGT